MDAETILRHCADSFTAAAKAAGIDGEALLARMPPTGQLVTGRQVPVVSPAYRNTCSILFYLNWTRSGSSWPYVRFHTFKHGGITTEFNGLRCWQACSAQRATTPHHADRFPARIAFTHRAASQLAKLEAEQNSRRATYVRQLDADYARASALTTSAQWIQHRLCGLAHPALLSRLAIRQTSDGRILLPLSHPQRGVIGYHCIRPGTEGDIKRHYIEHSGWLRGAHIPIKATRSEWPTAICEGVVTALSVALFWPGNILIALCAHNLGPVRAALPERTPVYLLADNDQWKPEIGNIGILAAQAAQQPQDIVCWPRFGAPLHHLQPTDFNDLLCLAGADETCRQLRLTR